MKIRPYQLTDESAVISLWQDCNLTRSQNDPAKDIARKLRVNPEWFLIAETSDGEIAGTIMAGYEGHRGWINYLAVAPTMQRQGLGRKLMAEAERQLRLAGCPKINLQVRPENTATIEFYRQLGFAVEGAISLGKRLVTD